MIEFEESLENSRRQALALPNRGPLVLNGNGSVDHAITDAYWKYGFYVLEDVVSTVEIDDLNSEFQDLLARSPSSSGATTDSQGRPLEFDETQRTLFRFARPLTDPYGETDVGGGRYQVRMSEPPAPKCSPKEVLLQIGGILQFLDAALRIYGHPRLLALAEAVNGPDFTPFTETMWIKQPRLGAAVSWHQDGTTHWSNPDLDQGSHGFNYMLNLRETTPSNALWVIPGSHKHRKANLKQMVKDSGSERLEGALPMLCKSGDVAICNRQIVHGSFPNTSADPRYTLVFGFHRRNSVLGVQGWAKEPFTKEFVETSCRLIDIAIAARQQKYPLEQSYQYKPSTNRYASILEDQSQRIELANYQRYAIGI